MGGVGVTETDQLPPSATRVRRHPTRSRRSDAVRNAERVFAAALEVSASVGLAVGLPEVAARAGVGRATVYRSFASRDELIAAIMEHKLRALVERMAVASRQGDAWEVLRDVLVVVMSNLRQDRLLGEALLLRPDLLPTDPEFVDLLERGKAQGAVAADVTGLDLRLLVSGVAHSLAVSGERDPDAWARAAEMIAKATRIR
jgi:AcrR family transcriptional regulator